MPQFIVTDPNGNEYEVNGPDGSTKEQALQYVQAMLQEGKLKPRAAAAKEELPDRTLGEFGKDIGTSLLAGGAGMMQGLVGLADLPTGGAAGKALEPYLDLEEVKKHYQSQYSPQQKAAQKAFEESEGILGSLKAIAENPSVIMSTVGESLPSMVGGAGLGRMVSKVPAVAGAIGEGLMGAGSAAEQIRQESPEGDLSGRGVASALGSGALTAALGYMGGSLAKRYGFSDIDTMMAGGTTGTAGNFAKRMIGSGITEGAFEELPQSVQEQMWMNYAQDKPIMEGVEKAGVLGAVTGGAMGSVAGALQSGATEQPPADTETAVLPEQPASELPSAIAPTIPAFTEQAQRVQQELEDEATSAMYADWLGTRDSKAYRELKGLDFNSLEDLDKMEEILSRTEVTPRALHREVDLSQPIVPEEGVEQTQPSEVLADDDTKSVEKPYVPVTIAERDIQAQRERLLAKQENVPTQTQETVQPAPENVVAAPVSESMVEPPAPASVMETRIPSVSEEPAQTAEAAPKTEAVPELSPELQATQRVLEAYDAKPSFFPNIKAIHAVAKSMGVEGKTVVDKAEAIRSKLNEAAKPVAPSEPSIAAPEAAPVTPVSTPEAAPKFSTDSSLPVAERLKANIEAIKGVDDRLATSLQKTLTNAEASGEFSKFFDIEGTERMVQRALEKHALKTEGTTGTPIQPKLITVDQLFEEENKGRARKVKPEKLSDPRIAKAVDLINQITSRYAELGMDVRKLPSNLREKTQGHLQIQHLMAGVAAVLKKRDPAVSSSIMDDVLTRSSNFIEDWDAAGRTNIPFTPKDVNGYNRSQFQQSQPTPSVAAPETITSPQPETYANQTPETESVLPNQRADQTGNVAQAAPSAGQPAVSAPEEVTPVPQPTGTVPPTTPPTTPPREPAPEVEPVRVEREKKPFLDRAVDYVETMLGSSEAALVNNLRRGLEKMGLPWAQIQKVLLAANTAQAVHDGALGAEGVRAGKLVFDPSGMVRSVVVPDTVMGMEDSVKRIGAAKGKSEAEISTIFQDLMNAWRARELHLEAENVRRIADEKTSRTEKAAYLKANRNKLTRSTITASSVLTQGDLPLTLEHANNIIKSTQADFPEFFAPDGPIAMWGRVRENTINFMVQSGHTSRAQAEHLLDAAAYVPWKRVMEAKDPDELVQNIYTGKATGFMRDRRQYKLKGSSREIQNIFRNIEQWQVRSLAMAVRNHKMLQLVDAARMYLPEGSVTKLGKFANKDGAVSMYRHGVKEFYTFSDPLYPLAFRGLQTVSTDSLKFLQGFAEKFRRFIVLNPLFTISQLSQDTFAAMYASGLRNPLALPLEVAKQFIGTLTTGTEARTQLKRTGIVGAMDFSAQAMMRELDMELGLRGTAETTQQRIIHGLEKFSSYGDNAVRQAVYARTLKELAGDPNAEAIAAIRAADIINFRRRGASAISDMIRQVTPFYGAYLQAQRVALHTLSGRGIAPTQRKEALATLAMTTAQMAALGFIYAMANSGDDDYEKRSPSEMDNKLLVPGTEGNVAIPLRKDWTLLPHVIGIHAYRAIMGGFEDTETARKAITDTLVSSIAGVPIGPALIRPAVEVAIDHSFFTGEDIVGQGLEGLDTEQKYTANTSELGKLVGKTGVIAPVNFDHLMKGYLGLVSGTVFAATDAAIRTSMNVPYAEKDAWDAVRGSVPGISTFMMKGEPSGDAAKFYEFNKTVQNATKSIGRYEKTAPDEVSAIAEEKGALLDKGVKREMSKRQQELKKLREEEIYILSVPNKEMLPAEKRERLNELKEQRRQVLAGIQDVRDAVYYRKKD